MMTMEAPRKTNGRAPSRFSASDAEFALAQRHFDFLMPYKKALYSVREAAKAIGREQDFVRKLIELGRLEAHADSAFGTQKTNLVTRRSILVYHARTAQYAPADFIESFADLLRALTPDQLTKLIVLATQERARR
jgi:hypothetical protein